MGEHTTVGIKAGKKEWIGLAVLILPVLLVSMDITVLYFALPSLSASLNPSGTEQLWMVDIYGFMLAGLLITMGGLGDRIGRRRLLLIGTVIFAVASATASLSTSALMLIAARAAQGIGGATLMPSTLGLIRNMFHDVAQRRVAITVWSIGMSGGSALGPVLAGVLLNNFWWGSIFLVNVPVALVLLAVAPALVPEFVSPSRGRFDLLSSLLSLLGILPLVWGLQEFAAHGISTGPIAGVLVGIVIGGVFIRRQLRHADPMVDFELFAIRGFGPSVLVNLTCYFVMVGFGIFTTQYLMEVLRMSPLEAALWTLASPVAIGICAPIATKLVGTVRPAVIIATAFLITALGAVLMTQLQMQRNIPLVIGGAAAIAVGIAVAGTLVTDLVVGAAPVSRSARVSALLQTAQELGGAMGIAVLGTIGATVFGRTMDKTIPAGLPAGALAESRQTLGGAHNYAKTLPQPQQDDLFHVAQQAFVHSLHPVAAVAAVAAALGAVLALTRLYHLRSDGDRNPADALAAEDEGVTDAEAVLDPTVVRARPQITS